MARGWESKSIEDQIQAREEKRETRLKPVLTESEIKQRARREELTLSRTKILRDLETTHNERYKALMKRTLAHIEAELTTLNSPD
jgi:hypothetical protein